MKPKTKAKPANDYSSPTALQAQAKVAAWRKAGISDNAIAKAAKTNNKTVAALFTRLWSIRRTTLDKILAAKP